MPDRYYEVLVSASRYWFALLGILIVLRAYRWLFRARSERRRRLHNLPDAGTVGEFLVIQGSDELPEGSVIPVPWEGTLGFSRGNDVCIPCEGLRGLHADLYFEKDDGLIVIPRRGCSVTIDEREIRTRRDAQSSPMLHGSVLMAGRAVLRLRVFVGLEIARAAAPAEMYSAPETSEAYVQQPQEEPRYYDPQSPYPDVPLAKDFYDPDAFVPAYREPEYPEPAAPMPQQSVYAPPVQTVCPPVQTQKEYLPANEQTWGMGWSEPDAPAQERFSPDYLRRFSRPDSPSAPSPVTPEAAPMADTDPVMPSNDEARPRRRRRKEQA